MCVCVCSYEARQEVTACALVCPGAESVLSKKIMMERRKAQTGGGESEALLHGGGGWI